MEDLLNKKNYKIMSVLSQPEILWDMKTETEIPCEEIIYRNLDQFIKIDEWIQNFYSYYQKWLHEDYNYVYDILSPINQDMLNAIIKYNKSGNDERLFLWFDIDRDTNEEFQWKYCPLSKVELVDLGINFHPNNRLVSPIYPLVFPDTI